MPVGTPSRVAERDESGRSMENCLPSRIADLLGALQPLLRAVCCARGADVVLGENRTATAAPMVPSAGAGVKDPAVGVRQHPLGNLAFDLEPGLEGGHEGTTANPAGSPCASAKAAASGGTVGCVSRPYVWRASRVACVSS